MINEKGYSMIFYEKFRVVDALWLVFTRRRAFYGHQTRGANLARRLLAFVRLNTHAEKIDFCHVAVARGIRLNAFKAAEVALERLPGREWADSLSTALGLDFWMVVRKFFFDELYTRFEFLEFALRYAEEHANEKHLICVSAGLSSEYQERLLPHFRTRRSRKNPFAGIVSLMLLPLFVELFYLLKGARGSMLIENRIVCEVDAASTLEMFSTLFAQVPRDGIVFVSKRGNAAVFETDTIQILGLRKDGVQYLRRVVWHYLWQTLRYIFEVRCLVDALSHLFYVFMQGRSETISGSNNLYCTFEHLVTTNWIRNIFLNMNGNKTAFVLMNTYVTSRYFHSEAYLNYDVVCAAGPHIEEGYRLKHALTKVFLSTGSYHNHRGVIDVANKPARLARLYEFRKKRKLVTIISPGVCDPTYGHELKLMGLARTLAQLPDTCVLLRLKPVSPPAKYENFYQQQTENCPNLLVTSGEFELFDFLELNCLFVTSISTAAYDLAQEGAQVMFIDFLRDPDLITCWNKVPGFLLSEDEGLGKVIDWLEDRNNAREHWAAVMKQFLPYISFRHPNFQGYHSTLLAQLQPFAPQRLTSMTGLDVV